MGGKPVATIIKCPRLRMVRWLLQTASIVAKAEARSVPRLMHHDTFSHGAHSCALDSSVRMASAVSAHKQMRKPPTT